MKTNLTFSDLFNRLTSLPNRGHQNTLYGVIVTGVLASVLAGISYGLLSAVELGLNVLVGVIFADQYQTFKMVTTVIWSVMRVGSFLSVLVTALGMLATVQAGLLYFKGESWSIGDLVKKSFMRVFSGPMLLSAMVWGLLSTLGSVSIVFCILPIFIVTMILTLGMYRYMDLNEPLGKAVRNAFSTFSANFSANALFAVAVGVVSTICTLLSCTFLGLLWPAVLVLATGVIYASNQEWPIFHEMLPQGSSPQGSSSQNLTPQATPPQNVAPQNVSPHGNSDQVVTPEVKGGDDNVVVLEAEPVVDKPVQEQSVHGMENQSDTEKIALPASDVTMALEDVSVEGEPIEPMKTTEFGKEDF